MYVCNIYIYTSRVVTCLYIRILCMHTYIIYRHMYKYIRIYIYIYVHLHPLPGLLEAGNETEMAELAIFSLGLEPQGRPNGGGV